MKELLEQIDAALSESDYRGQHQAPGRYGAPLHDLTENGVYPSDIYSPDAARLYGWSDPSDDRKVMNIIHEYQGKPNKWVRIYRSVPKSDYDKIWDEIEDLERQKKYILKHGKPPRRADTRAAGDEPYYDYISDRIEELEDKAEEAEEDAITDINSGDWVTIYRPYAVKHGHSSLGGDFDVISEEVRAKNVFTDGNSIYEWGYAP